VVSETGWSLRGHPFTFAPIVGRLDSQLLRRLTAEDASVDDPAHLLERAWFGQALGHRDRVVDLASRALRAVLQPPDKRAGGAIVALPWRREALAAAAMLSSALRELRDPERALHETEIFADDQYHPLMTSRAAALCDIGRWEEGKDLALSSQRIADSAQVRELLDRIRRHMAPPFSYAAG
jgi:hypothetical protein